jgi:hypothetical protein
MAKRASSATKASKATKRKKTEKSSETKCGRKDNPEAEKDEEVEEEKDDGDDGGEKEDEQELPCVDDSRREDGDVNSSEAASARKEQAVGKQGADKLQTRTSTRLSANKRTQGKPKVSEEEKEEDDEDGNEKESDRPDMGLSKEDEESDKEDGGKEDLQHDNKSTNGHKEPQEVNDGNVNSTKPASATTERVDGGGADEVQNLRKTRTSTRSNAKKTTIGKAKVAESEEPSDPEEEEDDAAPMWSGEHGIFSPKFLSTIGFWLHETDAHFKELVSNLKFRRLKA